MPASRKKIGYLVADGGRARILVRDGLTAPLEQVEQLESPTIHAPDRALRDDRPGRVHESANAARHAQEPRVDRHALEEARFIRSAVDRLRAVDEMIRFDSVVIAAAPRALHELRLALDAGLKQKIATEIDKDLTREPLAALDRHLARETAR